MTTMFDLESTATFHEPEATPTLYRTGSTPTLYRPESTAPLCRPEPTAILTGQSSEYGNLTAAAAWSVSPLGDPTVEDGRLSGSADFKADVADDDYACADFGGDGADFEDDQPVEDAKPRAFGKKTLITAAVMGALGGGVALALVVAGHTGWGHSKVAVVSPDASVGSVAPQVPASASAAPAPTSEVAPATTPTAVTPAPAPAPVVSPVPVPQNRGTGTSGGNQGNKGGGTPGGNQGGACPPGSNKGGGTSGGNQGGAYPPGGNKGGLNLPGLNLPGLNQPGGNKGGLNQPGTPGGQPQHPGKQPQVQH